MRLSAHIPRAGLSFLLSAANLSLAFAHPLTLSQPPQDNQPMALAAPSLFAAISGTGPGAEYANTKHGTIVKARRKRATLLTQAILDAHRLHREKITLWNSLSEADPDFQLSWHRWAIAHPRRNRIGQAYTLSGFQAFCSLCIPVSPATTASATPPTRGIPTTTPTSINYTLTAPDTLISTITTFLGPTVYYDERFYISRPLSPTNPEATAHLYFLFARRKTTSSYDLTQQLRRRGLVYEPGDQIVMGFVGVRKPYLKTQLFRTTVTAVAP